MDINLFRNHLAKLSEATQIIDKTDKRGINGAAAYLDVLNAGFASRSLWLPDKSDVAFFGASELKKVYRFYVNDNPTGHGNYSGSGLVRVDLAAGTVQTLDQEKYVKSGQKLIPSVWGRPYKIKSFTVFDKAVLSHQ